MPKIVKPVTTFIKRLIRSINVKQFNAPKEPEAKEHNPHITEAGHTVSYDIHNTLPFLIRADLNDYATDSYIYNPVGSEKLLKKIADDLAATFVLTTTDGQLIIADRALMAASGTSADQLAIIAEQNIHKLFQERRVVRKDLENDSALYTILLNSRNEASFMFSKKIWDVVSAQHKDYILVSTPRFNEIHYCTLKGQAVPELISYTVRRFNHAGNEALSPNVYLYHNASWVMFAHGPEQVLDYCLKHGLLKLNFNT
jgi:hypothetical protein